MWMIPRHDFSNNPLLLECRLRQLLVLELESV